MTIKVWAQSGSTAPELVNEYDAPLGEVVADLRQYWQEGEPGAVFTLWYDGCPVATLIQPQDEPEMCITTWADGSPRELHRCRYILDADGRYERTEVTVWE